MTDIVNPVLRGTHPDPSWTWDPKGERVAIVNSTFEYVPGLPIHVTDDLAHYELVGYAVDGRMAHELLLDYVLDSGGLYAPTLRVVDGRYVIACTVSRLDEDEARADGVDEATLARFRAAQGNFVIEADDLEGPWRGPYWIEGAEGIDPDLSVDGDGAVYWTQTRGVPDAAVEGQGEIWTQRIDPDGWTLCDDPGKTPIWRSFGAGAVWSEGPHLYRIGDWTYLMDAEGGTGLLHCETIMRAHTPHGLAAAIREATEAGRPIMDTHGNGTGLFRPNPANPFLTHRMLGEAVPVQSVGHDDLLHHPTMGWWLACLATRQTPTADGLSLNFTGRETFVAPIAWERAHGDAVVDGNGEPVTDLPGEPDGTPGWPVLAGGTGRLVREWHADGADVAVGHVGFDDPGTQRLGVEELRDPKDVLTVRGDLRFLFHRLTEPTCVIELPGEGHVRLRQDGHHRIELVTDGLSVRWAVRTGERLDEGYAEGPGPWSAVLAAGRLVIGTGDDPLTNRLAELDATTLSVECAQTFVGCMVGIEEWEPWCPIGRHV